MSYKIALLDDEPVQLNETQAQVERLLKEEGLDAAVMVYHSAFAMPAPTFDAYLLDISMPGVDGLSLAARIRAAGSVVPIVFITGIEERVFEALRVQPLRFVRKSRLAEELPEAVHALCAHLREDARSTLAFQSEGMLLRVPVSSILYVESSDKVQRVVLAQRQYPVRSTMAYFEEQLLGHAFMRVHRCYRVNRQAIYSIDGGDVVLADGSRLPVSRFKLTEVKEAFKKVMFHV